MEMGYIGLAVVLSLVALLMAMVALKLVTDARCENAAKKGKSDEKKGTSAFNKTDADRIQQAVLRREHENFMNYDGTEQPPIDPDRILGE